MRARLSDDPFEKNVVLNVYLSILEKLSGPIALEYCGISIPLNNSFCLARSLTCRVAFGNKMGLGLQ